MLTGGRRLRRAIRFLNPGPVGLLFILFFIILLAIMAPIALRIGKLFVEPILWIYESRNYSVGLSLTSLAIPMIVTIILAGLLHKRRRRIVPAIMANEWFWVFVITYVVVITALPVMAPVAAAVLLSLNAPMIIAAPLIFITAFGLAREVNEGGYWVAAEAYIALFASLLLSDLATAVMAGVATEAVHLFTKASLVIGDYGATDGLVLIPTEAAMAAIAALITVTLITVVTVVVVKYLDVLKIVFKNALVDIGLSVLLITGVLLGLRIIPYNLAGPVFGAAISLFATGLYNVTNYLSLTTTLNHEFNVGCLNDDCSVGRVIIRVWNVGDNIANNVYALISVRARRRDYYSDYRWRSEKKYLKDFLINEDLCGEAIIRGGNPSIDDEALPWLFSGGIVRRNISIEPGHSGRLVIFEYRRVPDGYVIKIPSEFSTDKPRVCLGLDFDVMYVFHIVINAKNVRKPLEITLNITRSRLDILASLTAGFEEGFVSINEKIFNTTLNELLTSSGSI
jgi:hypothetical protein